jgi:integrase
MWHKLTKAAGVQRIRVHDARHSCGTTMHIRGVPMAVIAKWLAATLIQRRRLGSTRTHKSTLCMLLDRLWAQL